MKARREWVSNNPSSAGVVSVTNDTEGSLFILRDCVNSVTLFLDKKSGKETLMVLRGLLRESLQAAKEGQKSYHGYVSTTGIHPLKVVDFVIADERYIFSIGVKGKLLTFHGNRAEEMISKMEIILDVMEEALEF